MRNVTEERPVADGEIRLLTELGDISSAERNALEHGWVDEAEIKAAQRDLGIGMIIPTLLP